MRTTRTRAALLVVVAFSSLLLITAMSISNVSSQGKYLVYIGSYGKGINAFRFDTNSLTLDPLGMVGSVVNPSFLTTDPDFKYLYAVSEVEEKVNGGVAAFTLDRGNGSLHPLNHLDSGGEAPCHLSVDHTGKMVIVANYVTGGVSSYPIEQNGALSKMSSLMTAHGSGPDKERQDGSHAHEAIITKDNARVYVPDLGLDRIRIYRIDPSTAKLVPNDPPFAKTGAGFGPRHLAFSPDEKFAYVINELKPFVTVFSRDSSNGSLSEIQSVPTIPADFKEENSGAEIRMDHAGRFVYASNRGHDSIQVFAVDPAKGTLHRVQIVSTQGKEPRGFNLDPSGHFLLVGNQKSNSLLIFKVNPNSGQLTDTGKHVETEAPVDVYFVPEVS